MKIVKRLLGAVFLLLLFFVGGIYLYIKSTLPDYNDAYHTPGIKGKIEIYRDDSGIPHIFADHQDDLAFGMGFVMAQDRLWQMDLFRRVATGRLSEIFGERTLKTDRFAKVLGFQRSAGQLTARLSPAEKSYLAAFVKGINTCIANQPDEHPIEFDILRYAPDPFTPEDIVALSNFQAYASNHNWKYEILRAAAIQELGPRKGRELVPAITFHGPYMALPGHHDPLEGTPADAGQVSRPAQSSAEYDDRLFAALLEADARIRQIAGLQGNQVHSNFWVVSGERSQSGRPIFANDYHMPFLLPSLWYGLHLVGDGIDAVGITLPGSPTIVAGHNRHIAWGATTAGADTQDLFQEKLDPENNNQYLYKGIHYPFETVEEQIQYRSKGELKTETLRVRISLHGPIINAIADNLPDDGPPFALHSVAGAAEGQIAFCMKIVRASSWQEFKQALALVGTPVWNWGYADIRGNIGYRLNGKIPIRSRGRGLEPVPGWTGEYEWRGSIPFDALPEVFNPATGYIVSANNEILDTRYPYSIFGSTFQLPYRAMRIEELLKARDDLTFAAMQAIQADTHSRLGLRLARYFIAAAAKSKSTDKRVVALNRHLKTWDGTTGTDSIATAIVQESLTKLMENTFANKTSEKLYAQFLKFGNLNYACSVLLLMMQDAALAHWFDDPATPAVEDRDQVLIRSLAAAHDSLTELLGDNVSDWRWGRLHQLTFKHQMGTVPPFKWLWNIGPREYPGDCSTVNPGTYTDLDEKPYRVAHGASMRHLVDFGKWEDAGLVITTGQSGRWGSPHYDDQSDLWYDMKYLKIPMNAENIKKDAAGCTVFSPLE